VEIHKPKLAHSLAEFAREMGAVILGILIAPALEQAVDERVWETDQGDAWDFIRLVEGDPGKRTSAHLNQVRAGINKARRLDFLIAINAKDQLDWLRSLGVVPPSTYLPAEQRECKAIQRG